MDEFPNALARTVAERWGSDLRSQREVVESLIASGGSVALDTNTSMSPGTVRVPSLGQSHIDLKLSWEVQDPTKHGTFDRNSTVYLLNLIMVRSPKSGVAEPLTRYDRISDDEEDEWAFAAYGSTWFDYAYRVVTGPMLVRQRPTRFAVFVTGTGEPFLAPEDFAWHTAGSGGPATRQKLRPRTVDRKFEEFLRHVGDVTRVKDS